MYNEEFERIDKAVKTLALLFRHAASRDEAVRLLFTAKLKGFRADDVEDAILDSNFAKMPAPVELRDMVAKFRQRTNRTGVFAGPALPAVPSDAPAWKCRACHGRTVAIRYDDNGYQYTQPCLRLGVHTLRDRADEIEQANRGALVNFILGLARRIHGQNAGEAIDQWLSDISQPSLSSIPFETLEAQARKWRADAMRPVVKVEAFEVAA